MENNFISAPSAGERVAKELAEAFDFECVGMDDHDYEACEKCARMRERMKRAMAAALAACAREAKLEVLHRLPNHAWPDKTSYPQEWGAALANAVQDELWKAMEENRAALERAAGERAGDLRAKS